MPTQLTQPSNYTLSLTVTGVTVPLYFDSFSISRKLVPAIIYYKDCATKNRAMKTIYTDFGGVISCTSVVAVGERDIFINKLKTVSGQTVTLAYCGTTASFSLLNTVFGGIEFTKEQTGQVEIKVTYRFSKLKKAT